MSPGCRFQSLSFSAGLRGMQSDKTADFPPPDIALQNMKKHEAITKFLFHKQMLKRVIIS
jgi:hypothetical protein